MAKDSAYNRHHEIQPGAAVQSEDVRLPVLLEHPYGQKHQDDAARDGIDNHRFGIELQMFLVARANAGDTDDEQGHNLAMQHMPILINVHQFDTVVDVHKYATPTVQHIGVYGILEEFQYNRRIDECTEYLIQALQVFAFFHVVTLLCSNGC